MDGMVNVLLEKIANGLEAGGVLFEELVYLIHALGLPSS